jgi:carbonic anhydrase
MLWQFDSGAYSYYLTPTMFACRSAASRVLRLATVLLLLTLPTAAEPPGPVADHTANPQAVAPGDALQRLKAGNDRFVEGQSKHPHEAATWRTLLEREQHPFAVVLGCSDSRVPPELIFDQGFGDLFVVRVAGNVVDTDVIASIEYAVDHLDTQLVVVMGHSGCGAVTATLDHMASAGDEAAEVVELFYRIEPAITALPTDATREQQIRLAVNNNVRLAVRRLMRVPDLAERIKTGKLQVVGATYDMHTGRVIFAPSRARADERDLVGVGSATRE